MAVGSVRGALARWALHSDNSASVAARARLRRADMLYRRFPDLAEMTVLDLGGTPAFWAGMVRPRRVVTVNQHLHPPVLDWVEQRIGDACALPADLATGWDLVFSNSTIEHVGGHAMRLRFADSVRTAGRHHWVQTPNRWFPVEPHWLLPFHQWLPTDLKARLSALAPAPSRREADRRRAIESALSVELLTAAELQHYFPGSHILRERLAGLTKSLIATA